MLRADRPPRIVDSERTEAERDPLGNSYNANQV